MTIHAPKTLPEGGKAQRVYLSLSNEISNGVYAAGTMLPGENRLAERFGVSRITIRRALDALAADQRIEKKTGAGSIVLKPHEDGTTIAANFATLMPQLVEMGHSTTARLLSFSYGPAPGGIATDLNLGKGQSVQTAVRVRYADGKPFSHLTTHVPEDIARHYDEADLATQPLFQLFERSGVSVQSAYQTVSATLAFRVVSLVAQKTGSWFHLDLRPNCKAGRRRSVHSRVVHICGGSPWCSYFLPVSYTHLRAHET